MQKQHTTDAKRDDCYAVRLDHESTINFEEKAANEAIPSNLCLATSLEVNECLLYIRDY